MQGYLVENLRQYVTTFVILTLVMLSIACSQISRSLTDSEMADKQVLIQLEEAGSDLSKPHDIEFFLYFSDRTSADAAAAEIREQGFEVEVSPVAEGTEWLCFAKRTMVPEFEMIISVNNSFEDIAKSYGGEYDGWGAPTVK